MTDFDPTKIEINTDDGSLWMEGWLNHSGAFFRVPYITHLDGNLWMGGRWQQQWKTYTDTKTEPLTDDEIKALREFVKDDIPLFKDLLERARQYDIDNNEPDCELQEKKQRILDLAEELGIEIDFL